MNLARDLQVAALAYYLRAVRRTSRVTVDHPHTGSGLVTFWHDAMLPLLAASVGTKNVAIYVRAQPFLNDSLDLLNYLGVRAFISDQRGTAGIKAARQWLLEVPGRLLAITLDMGEPHVALPGVARLARMLGVSLHPLAVTVSRGYRTQREHSVVPHLRGQLSVRVLPAVSEPTLERAALALQNALLDSTLSEPAPEPSVPWRKVVEAWPRACMMPLTRGKLTVWPAKQPTTISF